MSLRNTRSFNPMTGRRTGAYSRISNPAGGEEYLAHLRKLKGKYHERKAKETEGKDRKFHEHMAKSLLGEASAVDLITGKKEK